MTESYIQQCFTPISDVTAGVLSAVKGRTPALTSLVRSGMVAPNDQTQKHKHLQTAANDKTHTKGEMQQKAHHSPKSFLRFLLLYVVLLFVYFGMHFSGLYVF